MLASAQITVRDSVQRDLWLALIRLRVLQHASQGPIFGLGIIEGLGVHGLQVSAGTLYPMPHSMENSGLLHSRHEKIDSHFRRVYRATPLGRRVLKGTKAKVRELVGDLF